MGGKQPAPGRILGQVAGGERVPGWGGRIDVHLPASGPPCVTTVPPPKRWHPLLPEGRSRRDRHPDLGSCVEGDEVMGDGEAEPEF